MRKSAVDLKRLLLQRVTLCAVVICVIGMGMVIGQTKTELRRQAERIGNTLGRLINAEGAQPRGAFERGLDGLALASLDDLGEMLEICVEVVDIFDRHIVQRCFGETRQSFSVLHRLSARVIGTEILYRGPIIQYPGFKVGEFVITPDVDRVAESVWRQMRTVFGMSAGILLLNLFLYRPVRRALQPSEQILAVMERMQAGDLSVRMPRPGLVELHRIACGFDDLADRLVRTLTEQRRLAQRLIAVREEERRHLARELHDEFGQCLTSVGADAAYLTERLRGAAPELLPAVESIAAVTVGMLEALQGLLGRLRPLGLETFGLQASLEQLLGGWQRRQPDCRFELDVDGDIDALPDELTVSLYRIVQESLTNALRHGQPQQVRVRLERDAVHCSLRIEDDGAGRATAGGGSGLGVLGMRERVLALGGRFEFRALAPRGMCVQAEFPAECLQETRGADA